MASSTSRHSAHKWSKSRLVQGANASHNNSENVYVFDNDIYDEDEINTDNTELTELRPRGGSKGSQPTQVRKSDELIIERPIEESDSLHTIALRYGCHVADLKRLNNLISDQDFFGLRRIKVPAKRHGLISEIIEKENEARQNGQHNKLGANNICDGPILMEDNYSDVTDYEDEASDRSHLLQNSNVRTLSIKDTLSSQSGAAVDFLHKMDKDIKSIVTSTKSRLDTLDEVKTRLTCRRFYPLESRKADAGADCGIRGWSFLVIGIMIVIVTPAFYFIYFEYLNT